jgi:uncharacterized protein DUF4388
MNRSADSNPQLAPPDSSSRPGSPARDGSFSGRLKALSICDVLEFLRVLNRRGVLVLRDEGREVSVQVRDGRVVGVHSNHPDGKLAAFLYREEQITREQMEAALERERNGERPARILIEAGVLTPKGLWEVLRRQAQRIIYELFEWEKGEFRFHESQEISGGGMDLGLPILDLVGAGIRSVRNTRLFTQRMPSEQSVFEPTSARETAVSLALEFHERYVLSLIDGEKGLAEVVGASEIGRPETLRVVFLLFSTGYLKMRAHQAPVTQPRDGQTLPLIRRYNEMFAFLHSYLVREVGPIGEAILSRYLLEQKKQQPVLLGEQNLGRDGTLDERLLQKNIRSLGNGSGADHLLDGLNELLYSEILAIRRTLGPHHEGRAVQGLRELGLQPVLHSEATSEEARKE